MVCDYIIIFLRLNSITRQNSASHYFSSNTRVSIPFLRQPVSRQVNMWKIINLNCGKGYEDMTDHGLRKRMFLESLGALNVVERRTVGWLFGQRHLKLQLFKPFWCLCWSFSETALYANEHAQHLKTKTTKLNVNENALYVLCETQRRWTVLSKRFPTPKVCIK